MTPSSMSYLQRSVASSLAQQPAMRALLRFLRQQPLGALGLIGIVTMLVAGSVWSTVTRR